MRSAFVATSHKGGCDTQIPIASLIIGVAIIVVAIVDDMCYITGAARTCVYLDSEAQLSMCTDWE